jgi:hypothetical protein
LSLDLTKIIEYGLFAIRAWFTLKCDFHIFSSVVSVRPRRAFDLLNHH